jgi:hypothetical protein
LNVFRMAFCVRRVPGVLSIRENRGCRQPLPTTANHRRSLPITVNRI